MSDTTPPPSALEERELLLKDTVYPYIIALHHFLGNVDYHNDFDRYIRPAQLSWEFHDKTTKDTFHTFVMGEVTPSVHGTRLGACGNYKPRKDEPVKSISSCLIHRLTYKISPAL